MSIETAKASRMPTTQASLVLSAWRSMSMNHSSTLTAAMTAIAPNSFCLRPEKPILTRSLRPLRMLRRIDIADEIVIDRADNEHDQAGDEREVDEGQDADDDVRRWRLGNLDDEFVQLDEKFQYKRCKPDHQAQEKRRYQPSAVEDDRFDKMTHPSHLSPPSYGACKIIIGSNQSACR